MGGSNSKQLFRAAILDLATNQQVRKQTKILQTSINWYSSAQIPLSMTHEFVKCLFTFSLSKRQLRRTTTLAEMVITLLKQYSHVTLIFGIVTVR